MYNKITKMRHQLFVIWMILILCSCKQKGEDNAVLTETKSLSAQTGCCVPEVLDTAWYSSGKKAPLFSGLDGIHFPVSTKNPEAQKYFDQGMMLSFAFNHAEAGRSFYEAARQDSTCAMCWWGFAYVLGPNYNGGMEINNFSRAYDAIQKAKSLSASCSEKEQYMIEALTHRYSNDTAIARPVLDSSYSAAMRKVYNKYSDDVTVATLFAESLMDLHPWNLYTKDGTIQPWTPEILSVLEKCLQIEPRHAGVNHFYIHATEMSQHAETALASADLLRDLVPGAGHLVHMPSHTYIRIGKYHDGVVANQKAVLVDSLYVEACHAQGVYPLAYYPHNYHFISACATLSGESKIAMTGANATSSHSHKKLLRDPAWATLQHYYSIPWFVEVKLGLWNEILSSDQPEKDLKYPSVIWHYAQGMARLSQKNMQDAKKHLAEMKAIMTDTSIKDLTIWGINSVFDICIIASETLEGEIYAKEKNYSAAISHLQEAVKKEDALNYDEPPDWFFSIRHHLGAVLMDAGKFKEAIKVYEEDLKTFRDNGWALKGLMNAHEKLGDKRKYDETKTLFDKAWKHADIKITSSRIL
jgi:tetratricopeptide (TPR) repeat protein